MIISFFKSKNTLVTYGMAYTVAGMAQKGLGFLVFMYLANVLSVSEYSFFGLGYSLFSVLAAFSLAGIYETTVGQLKENETQDARKALFYTADVSFGILSMLGLILSIFFLGLFDVEGFPLSWDLAFILFGAVLSSYFVYKSSILRLDENHKRSLIFAFFPPFTAYMFGLIALQFEESAMQYYAWSCSGFLIVFIVFFNRRVEFRGVDLARLKIFFTKIGPYIVIAILSWVSGYGNTFFVKFLFDDIDVSLFVFLFTISSIIQLVASSMNQVWSPRFFVLYGSLSLSNVEKKNRYFTIVQGIVLGLTGCIALIAYAFFVPMFDQISNYKSGESMLVYLFLGYIVSIPWWHVQNYYLINNRGKSLMNVSIVSGILGYAIWVACMVYLGKLGIYIGFLINMLSRMLFAYINAFRIWKIRFQWEGVSVGAFILLIGILISNQV